VDARDIGYVEGHGSGTKLGDPIELAALTQAFRADTADTGFCALGSVKSNVAHLLAAAGIAGLTKVLLQLRHGQIAPSLHAEALNPAIDFDSSPFRVQRELADWPRPAAADGGEGPIPPRRAGITSIGAGGMNSHIVVEEYLAPPEPGGHDDRPRLMVFSAMHRAALAALLERMRGWLADHPDADMARLSFTLQAGRTALPCRLAAIAASAAELRAALEAFSAGSGGAGVRFVPNVLEVEAPDAAPLDRACRDGDLGALAAAWTAGATIDWALLWGDRPPRRLALPTYPFEKLRCWVEIDPEAPSVLDPEAHRRKLHPLIGRNLSDLHGVGFATDLHLEDLLDWRYLRDGRPHLVETLLPEAALAAARLAGFADPVLTDGRRSPCEWSAAGRLRFDLTAAEGTDALRIEIFAEDAANPPVAVLRAGCVAAVALPVAPPVSVADGGESLAADAAYENSGGGGLSFAPYQTVLRRVDWGAEGGVAELAAPPHRQNSRMRGLGLTPEAAGGILQTALLAARRLGIADWSRLTLAAVAAAAVAPLDGGLPDDTAGPWRLRFAARRGGDGLVGDWRVLDATGREAARLDGLTFLPPEGLAEIPAETSAETPADDWVFQVLRRELSDILKLPAEEIHPRIGLYALGLDSISLTALINRVNAALGSRFTPALAFEADTVAQLAERLAAGVASAAAPVAAAPRPVLRRTPRPAEPAARSGDAVAVIGMAGRFPGAADPDAFWQLLREGRQALSDLPLDRYDAAYAARVAAADFPKRGGFLDGIDRFDAGFFSLSPAEAERMDPQHRLFLETAWAAVENAGYRPRGLAADTGVFVGVSGNDHALLMAARGVEADAQAATGSSHAMLANRVSFVLDVHGPSEAIDTACSSSLVAVHRAMEAIRGGRCGMALAGGVNLALALESCLGPQRAGMLSPDGRCKTFADDADGYVRGEGVGAVLLKPLGAAERDGDRILGVLIGGAENHGGRAGSLTAPNARAQADLIVSALNGIDPAGIDYVEAHGTGTALGDPVEVNALKAAFARAAEPFGGRRFAPASCGLGSVKTNIGHLEAAAGIAGLIKLLLSLRAGELPPSLDCPRLNPYLDFSDGPFTVLRRSRPWPASPDRPRRAGLSSFGFGGTNAHLVVEDYRPAAPSPRRDGQAMPVTVSARTPEGLRRLAAALAARAGNATEPLEDIAWTLASGREPMEERLAFVAASTAEMAAILRGFAAGDDGRVLRGRVRLGTGFPVSRAESDGDPGAEHLYAEPPALLARWGGGGAGDWARLWADRTPRRVELPGYPFAGESHWILASPPVVAAPAAAGEIGAALGLLDRLSDGSLGIDAAAQALAGGGR
jgi:polyketide synthase PksL